MKHTITLTALAAALSLGACSEPAEVPEAEPAEDTAMAETGPLAVDGMPVPGDYTVTMADGTTMSVSLTEDGTAIYTDADGTETMATYTGGTADEPYCVTVEGDEEPSCYSEQMVDGVWTATSVDDPEITATVTRVVAE